jgi:hypothetical protein
MKTFLLTLILVIPLTAMGQNNCQPMPGVRLANPKCQQSPQAAPRPQAGNAIEWTFPKPDQVSINKEGRTYYALTDDVFSEKPTIGREYQVEAALVYFTPKIVATFELMYVAGKLKDVDWFLAFSAIGLAVKSQGIPDFIGKGQCSKKSFSSSRYGTAALCAQPFRLIESS